MGCNIICKDLELLVLRNMVIKMDGCLWRDGKGIEGGLIWKMAVCGMMGEGSCCKKHGGDTLDSETKFCVHSKC